MSVLHHFSFYKHSVQELRRHKCSGVSLKQYYRREGSCCCFKYTLGFGSHFIHWYQIQISLCSGNRSVLVFCVNKDTQNQTEPNFQTFDLAVTLTLFATKIQPIVLVKGIIYSRYRQSIGFSFATLPLEKKKYFFASYHILLREPIVHKIVHRCY